MSQVIPFSIFESVNICLKHFVKVSAVDKGRFRFTISWHIIVSDFVTAFRRSISLLVSHVWTSTAYKCLHRTTVLLYFC